MRVRKEIGFLLLLIVGAGSIGVSLGAAWFYVQYKDVYVEQEMQTEIVRLQSEAHSYYQKYQSYVGVCNNIGIKVKYFCNDSWDSFAISAESPNGSFYCADSTGYFGEELNLPYTHLTCS